MTMNMGGIAKLTTWLGNASMIAKRFSELPRSRQVRPKKRVDSNHQGSEGAVENSRLTEFDNSWNLMRRRIN